MGRLTATEGKSHLKCPHCGALYDCEPETNMHTARVPTHDFPIPTRAVCPGSGRTPFFAQMKSTIENRDAKAKVAKKPAVNQSKYDIAKEYSAGFSAGLLPASRDDRKSDHWYHGYDDAYRSRCIKHALLNEYLRSIGVEQMGYVQLAGTPPASNPETEWVAEKRTEPVADVEKQFGMLPGALALNEFGKPETYDSCPHCKAQLYGRIESRKAHIIDCPHNPKAPL